MASFPNTNRRMFRGRAGATDSQLNKHQQRRRKHPQPPRPKKNNKYGDFDESHNQEDEVASRDMIAVDGIDVDDSGEGEVLIVNNDLQESEPSLHVPAPTAESEDPPEASEPSPAVKEMKHLCKRIQNVSESISLSSDSISNPTTWKNNVLNAVLNAILEWRAILNHYSEEELSEEETKAPSLAAYMLVQQAMQSGPLTGSNPGYFKRCGSAVAREALDFLEQLPHQEARFSEKQMQAIEKWKCAARKAVENDKPPSKSQLKKQTGKKEKK